MKMRYLGKITLALLAIFMAYMPGSAQAQYTDERLVAFYGSWEPEIRIYLQRKLVWVDAFKGIADGQIGTRTIAAIKTFQEQIGAAPTGYLTKQQVSQLIDIGGKAENLVGYRVIKDPRTDMAIGVPFKLLSKSRPTKFGTQYLSEDERLDMATIVRPLSERSLREAYNQLLKNHGSNVNYKYYGDFFFVVAGGDSNKHFYVRFHVQDEFIKGFAISYPAQYAFALGRATTIMSSDFQPDSRNLSVAQARANPEAYRARIVANNFPQQAPSPTVSQPSPTPSVGGPSAPIPSPSITTGTAFLVSSNGTFLTNAHVVENCKSIGMGVLGGVKLIAADRNNDLALLKTEAAVAGQPLVLSESSPRLGEEVIALGYPLQSVLQNGLNVTRGDVSSLSGLRNDTRSIQITAAVQPGNSGGPLLDREGRLIGVVTSKLNAMKVAEATGDIPQSINFAIRLEMVRLFLETNGITPEKAPRTGNKAEVHDIVAKNQASVQKVACVQ